MKNLLFIVTVSFLFLGCSIKSLDYNKKSVKKDTIDRPKIIKTRPIRDVKFKKKIALKKIPIKRKEKVKNKFWKIPKKMSVQEKKKRFLSILVPATNSVYNELLTRYKNIKIDIENNQNLEEIELLKKSYKVNSNRDLLKAIKPHPKSIVLAQAAMESAWATSRFFLKANNIFGVWSFNKNEPRIPALKKRGNKTIWLKVYPNVNESIKDYYKTLGRSFAFEEFRRLKMKSNNPYELVKKLNRYSEKGDKYGDKLSSIIRYNKFYKYDK